MIPGSMLTKWLAVHGSPLGLEFTNDGHLGKCREVPSDHPASLTTCNLTCDPEHTFEKGKRW
jgi:hypothetical protein